MSLLGGALHLIGETVSEMLDHVPARLQVNGVEPFAYLRDVLQRMTEGYPMSRLDELLPWNWRPSIAVAA